MKKVGEDTISMSRKRGMSMAPTSGGRHGDQWQSLMRKFSQANKEKCKAVPTDMPKIVRGKKIFPTESTYEGSWNILGMSGDGIYCFPYPGVKYEGEFDDGMFHGHGELKYANGVTVKGNWKKGQVTDRKIIFGDGLEYSEHNWGYCKSPDRRYTLEYDHGLKPGGDTYVANEQQSPEIPPGYYDVGDGFYEPITRTVYKYNDLTGIVRSPDLREQKWILENCRTNPSRSVGPVPNLFEHWLQPDLELEVPPPPADHHKVLTDEHQTDSRSNEDAERSNIWNLYLHRPSIRMISYLAKAEGKWKTSRSFVIGDIFLDY
ncbi:MORN repeat-containing protein 5-like isoform X2 [Hyposmocoma kahamanoa]|uniref:MORN repeat-containing protein 5-like isoform X2 n=1 Tax=Hyposmocoma kahamanoa TaxID=1477025 RepID=UPI000E6D6510|nr:MORN repeat-containing protein 5-like isoform X2 [Hyposmocoma kahamanoa]